MTICLVCRWSAYERRIFSRKTEKIELTTCWKNACLSFTYQPEPDANGNYLDIVPDDNLESEGGCFHSLRCLAGDSDLQNKVRELAESDNHIETELLALGFNDDDGGWDIIVTEGGTVEIEINESHD